MNLLITGAWSCTEEQLEQIREKGHNIFFQQYEKDELEVPYEWVEGVICNGLFLTHPIEKFTNLRYIQLTSAGFDRVPMDYVKNHNIEIHNARGVYSIPMAEFALCGVLQLYKQSNFFRKSQEKRIWEKHRGLLELSGKNVCVVGCGSVGNECAKRFNAFGCHVYGIDIKPYNNEMYLDMYSIDQICEKLPLFDVVVLTLPLMDETFHLFDYKKLSLMKKNSVLVNISRGAIVDTQSLIKCLDKNISGAVLDVFEEEPLDSSSKLWNMENVILTPHNSFVGDENKQRLFNIIWNSLKCK